MPSANPSSFGASPSDRLRALRGVAAAGLVVLLVVTAASLRLFIWPPSDEPQPVDAVVALAGGEGRRLDVAGEIARAYPKTTLVLSVGDEAAVEELCAQTSPPDVRCFRAAPFRTSGEARTLGALARTHGWDSLAVVTSTTHLTRARLLVEQCVDARVLMIDAGHDGRPFVGRVVREWGGILGAFTFDRACSPARGPRLQARGPPPAGRDSARRK